MYEASISLLNVFLILLNLDKSDASKIETGYADGSDWYFQMVFCATTISIVSGTLAERIRLWPFFLFAAILALVYLLDTFLN